MKVMVVDASEEEREFIIEALNDLTGFVPQRSCSELGEAVRALYESAPDILVTDVGLYDGDGVALIQVARDLEPRPAVVVYATDDSPADRKRCLDAGADVWVPKWMGLNELKQTLLDLRLRSWMAARRGSRLSQEKREEMLGRLAGGFAHDLNNYFGAIAHGLGSLERCAESNGLSADWSLAREALKSATELTQTMLAYARGAAPPPAPVDFSTLIRRTLRMFKGVIPPNVRLTLELEDRLPELRGVPPELEQVVLNLVLNACEAMPAGGELHVSARVDRGLVGGRAVMLEVSDTGAGPPRETVGAGNRSSKADRNGLGLGLRIVRGAVERHGAMLKVGRHAGGGCRVLVSFPVVENGMPFGR